MGVGSGAFGFDVWARLDIYIYMYIYIYTYLCISFGSSRGGSQE